MAMMTMVHGEEQAESDNRSDEPGDPGDQDDSDGHKHDVLHHQVVESQKYKFSTQSSFASAFFLRFKKR